MISSHISGIPCQIRLLKYTPPWCGSHGHPDNWLPDEPAEVEFEVYDRKGYRAEWLERKMTESDRAHIVEQLMKEEA